MNIDERERSIRNTDKFVSTLGFTILLFIFLMCVLSLFRFVKVNSAFFSLKDTTQPIVKNTSEEKTEKPKVPQKIFDISDSIKKADSDSKPEEVNSDNTDKQQEQEVNQNDNKTEINKAEQQRLEEMNRQKRIAEERERERQRQELIKQQQEEAERSRLPANVEPARDNVQKQENPVEIPKPEVKTPPAQKVEQPKPPKVNNKVESNTNVQNNEHKTQNKGGISVGSENAN